MGFYPEEFIEEVKNSNDIVDVVSNYVNLKRKGTTYFGNCPFHREKTGSFGVNPEKQIFHCFGCGTGGNVIRFIMKIDNLGFKEAIEQLAERAKIPLPDTSNNNYTNEELKQSLEQKNNLYEINKLSGRFFYKTLQKSKIANEYIKNRKLSMNAITKFGIGFAPNDNSLYAFLKSQNFKEEDMLKTGLIGKNDRGEYYDKFRNRLMFPIFDIRGRVVAFGGRSLLSSEELKEKRIPKYVNSPENQIYTKGNHLYGLNFAKKGVDKLKRILVVEGYMDVITPHAYGVTNVVASLGTALTERQGKLLRQYSQEIVLSYDSDQAGQNAILRGIDVMQNLGVMCKVLQMQGAKDPDEYVLKYGPEKFSKLIDNSISAIEYKINILKSSFDLNDLNDKIRFLNKVAEVLSKVQNNIERDLYINQISKELGVGSDAIKAEIDRVLYKPDLSKKEFVVPNNNNQKTDSQNSIIEETILYLLTSKDMNIYNKVRKVVTLNDFSIPKYKSLLTDFYELYETKDLEQIDFSTIGKTEEEQDIISKILIGQNTENNYSKICDEVLSNFKINKLQNRKEELLNNIKSTQDINLKQQYSAELNEIIKQMAR